jgi:acyl-CoA thioesterase FadM
MLVDIPPGTPLLIMTALMGHARKTFTFRHYIFDVASGTQVAVGEITGVAIDLEKRRVVEWPDDIVAIFKSTLSKSPNS